MECRSMETELALPEDVLADILGRLPARDLAQSRRICKAWCALVDARRLLLRHALPHSVRGIFLNYVDYESQHFLARPSSSGPWIDGKFAFLPGEHVWTSIRDHRNGLILYEDEFSKNGLYVVNPATQQWASLPPLKEQRTWAAYIVFEPAVSLHYEVYLVPTLPRQPMRMRQDEAEPEDPYRLMEWPPSPCVLQVLSSKTGRWEERAFVREGEAAGIVADLRLEREHFLSKWHHAAYWHGKLYVHCRGGYLMRFSLSDLIYQIINTPATISECGGARSYLGIMKNEVYFAIIHEKHKLKIWVLKELVGQTSWILKYHINLESSAFNAVSIHRKQIDGEWIWHSEKFNDAWNLDDDDDGTNSQVLEDAQFDEETDRSLHEITEWDSDNDNVLHIRDVEEFHMGYVCILGFHPYKEVIFLAEDFKGVAYHLNTSKVQYLGNLRPKCYNYTYCADMSQTFLFTPCMIGELPENNAGNHLQD